jgi:hypothetical protein
VFLGSAYDYKIVYIITCGSITLHRLTIVSMFNATRFCIFLDTSSDLEWTTNTSKQPREQPDFCPNQIYIKLIYLIWQRIKHNEALGGLMQWSIHMFQSSFTT